MGKGGNNKKEQMPAAIKTTESIKNFRPFTAELPRRSTVGIYAREVNGHDAPGCFAVMILAQLKLLDRSDLTLNARVREQ